jgi:hypothetical protein
VSQISEAGGKYSESGKQLSAAAIAGESEARSEIGHTVRRPSKTNLGMNIALGTHASFTTLETIQVVITCHNQRRDDESSLKQIHGIT